MKYDYKRHSPLTQPVSTPSGQPSRLRADSAARRTEPAQRGGSHQLVQCTDAFRLLKVYPGPREAPLECNLLVRSLKPNTPVSSTSPKRFEDPEPYDALSYHWGDQSGEYVVKILVQHESTEVKIGRNLDLALRQLRSETVPIFLWVDALCIDQQNNDEKSAQIPLMRLIYNHATVVRVWLGEEAEDSDRAMDFVERCLEMKTLDRLVEDNEAAPEWAALFKLMRRTWFSRRWIIQEIALARSAVVHCGSKTIPWRMFASVISMLPRRRAHLRKLFRRSADYNNLPDYLGNLNELGATRLAHVSDNLFRKQEDGTVTEKAFSLEGLISSLTPFEASDPHDVLYAILWLANDAHPVTKNAFKVDVQQIYNNLQPNTPILTASPFVFNHTPPSYFHNMHEPLNNAPPGQLNTPGSSKRQRSVSDLGAGSNAPLPPNQPERRPTLTLMPPGQRERRPTLTLTAPDTTAGAEIPPAYYADGAGHHHSTPNSPTHGSQPEVHTSAYQHTDHNDRMDTSSSHSYSSNPERRPRSGSILSISTAMGLESKEQIAGFKFLERLQSSRIVVDYSKSRFDVCREFVNFTIMRSSTLDAICRPWAPKDIGTDEPLPSWIAQLSGRAFAPTPQGIYVRQNADSLVGQSGVLEGTSKPYRASRRLPAERCRGSHPSRSLVVKGFILDKVRDRMPPARGGVIPADWIEAGGWKRQNPLPPDLFWKTLVGNRDGLGNLPPPFWQFSCRDAFSDRPEDGDLDTREALFQCAELVGEFLERVQCMVWNRSLILLESLTPKANPKSLCLAPKDTGEGDLVCILHGCSVPVILRKIDNRVHDTNGTKRDNEGNPVNEPPKCATCKLQLHSDVYYKLIGECYVHGMMDGEAFSIQRDKNIKHQWFELR